MPDNSIECVLGRLIETVDNIKDDMAEMKADHKQIKDFVDEQRSLYRYVWAFVGFMGTLLYFGRDVYEFVNKVKHGVS